MKEERLIISSSAEWTKEMMIKAAIEIEKGNINVPSEYVYLHCKGIFGRDLCVVRYNEEEEIFELEVRY